MRRYLFAYAGFAAAGLVLVALVNWVVDPYGSRPRPTLVSLAAPKPEAIDHARLSKAFAVRQLRPRAIALGSSTAHLGLDPKHPGWRVSPVYNLALPAGSIREIRQYFEHALTTGRLERAVLGLDFFMFNVDLPARSDFDERRLCLLTAGEARCRTTFEPLLLLFSMDTLRSTLRTLRDNSSEAPEPIGLDDGLCSIRRRSDYVRRNGGCRKMFGVTEKFFMEFYWLPRPRREYRFIDPDAGRSTFEDLRTILSLARGHGVDLRLFISPSHARLSEARFTLGLWPKFEDWKRGLVRVAAEEAGGEAPFPIWDFSDYGELTTEEVPPPGDRESLMRWYSDPAHYLKELGDLVLDRIFDPEGSASRVQQGFGVLLTSDGIEEHLARIRVGRERYRASHPRDVAEIEALARSVSQRRAEVALATESGDAASSRSSRAMP